MPRYIWEYPHIGNQHFIGRTDAEAPIIWPPDMKSQLIGKDPAAGKDWRQEEKEMKEYEMVGWHHWLNGHEFEKIPGDSEGQGSLECCNSWDRSQTQLSNWKPTTQHIHSYTQGYDNIICAQRLMCSAPDWFFRVCHACSGPPFWHMLRGISSCSWRVSKAVGLPSVALSVLPREFSPLKDMSWGL